MKILVTGATSFLGESFLIAAKMAGHQVSALSRRRTRALEEICDTVIQRDILEVTADDLSGGFDAVAHFATGSDGDESHIIRVAVDGTTSLIVAAQEAGIPKILHVSSMSVYPGPVARDSTRLGDLALEAHPAWRGVYANSKTQSDEAVQKLITAGATDDLDITVVRPGLVFGKRMKGALAGTAVQLPLGLLVGTGGPDQGVPLLHIDDLSDGMIAVISGDAEPGRARVFDVLSGNPPSKRALVEAYRKLTGQPCRMIWPLRWVLYPLGWAMDRVLGLTGRNKHIAHKIDRMFAFEPGDLPHAEFWKAAEMEPKHDLVSCLKDSISADRDPPATDGAAEALRARATALTACVPTKGDIPRTNGDLILVGAGRIIEEMHLPAIAGLSGAKVRAVVDPNTRLAEKTAAALGNPPVAADIGDLDDDIVKGTTAVIATPGFNHVELATALMERGASALIEKPAALDEAEFAALEKAAKESGQSVSGFKNYRLRPNALKLWRLLERGDLGALVSANVIFHAPPLVNEQARWMMEEKRYRVLLLEQSIHFIDIACVAGGALESVDWLSKTDRADGISTLSFKAGGRMASGAALSLDMDLSGTATRTKVNLVFERCAVELDFYPEGFRVLPRGGNPVDELAAAAAKLGGFLWQRAKPKQSGVPKRVLPHLHIYRAHLTRDETSNPFDLDGIRDTMTTVYRLCEALYGAR